MDDADDLDSMSFLVSMMIVNINLIDGVIHPKMNRKQMMSMNEIVAEELVVVFPEREVHFEHGHSSFELLLLVHWKFVP